MTEQQTIRAVLGLTVVHAKPLPAALGATPPT